MRSRQSVAKPGIAREIGIAQRHQAHRRPGGREVERADVQIRDLLRRKQRETAAAGHHAADVVPLIDMRGSGDAVAQPDPRQYIVVDELKRFSPLKPGRQSRISALCAATAGELGNCA